MPKRRRIVRETRDTIFECGKVRVMLLEWENGLVSVRPKGTRRRQYINVAACWQRAVRAEVEAKRREGRRVKRGRRVK